MTTNTLPFEIIPTQFTAYKLTEEATKEGFTYSNTQLACISNEITTLTQAKLALKYDLSNPQDFVQKEAYLRGQIDKLQWLLSMHESFTNPVEEN